MIFTHSFDWSLAVSACVTRRSRLPCRSSDSNVSLWNILRNNIGKDLSKVSMPVHLNEPINTLQRLCEEMEYTQLLDTAARTDDPQLRMVSTHTRTHTCMGTI